MLLMIDNYDSFTYNLVQYCGELGQEVEVVRNDAVSVDAVGEMNPDYIIVSPGPCTPDQAGISMERGPPRCLRARVRRLSPVASVSAAPSTWKEP